MVLGLAVLLHSPTDAISRTAKTRPNIVVILADDLGYSDLGCYGGEIETPNLDRLAGNGLRFTQFYNSARCWPTRAALLTGYYAQQVRRDALPGLGGGARQQRPAWARLLPELLRPLGYRSYHSGKWHVDGKVLAGGFDRAYSLNDHDRYFTPEQHTLNDRPIPPARPADNYYATTAIAQHAIDMLAEHQAAFSNQPFFLHLTFTAPHFPLHARAEDIERFRDRYRAGWDVVRKQRYQRLRQLRLLNCALPSVADRGTVPRWNFSEEELRRQIGPGEIALGSAWNQLTDEQQQFQSTKMAIYAAMIHRIDLEIGRVVEQLKSMGLFDNTLLLFLSDNGSSAELLIRGDSHDRAASPGSAKTFLCLGPGWATAANTPFRLHKSWVHEGGISTPLIVHWPAGISARGELRHTPAHVIDLSPTIIELAGGQWPTSYEDLPLPIAPGKSIAPAFRRNRSIPHEPFWWYHDGNRAIRVGDWKLVADHEGPWELYNLRADRCESNNLASRHPRRVADLLRTWTKYKEQMATLVEQESTRRPPESQASARRIAN